MAFIEATPDGRLTDAQCATCYRRCKGDLAHWLVRRAAENPRPRCDYPSVHRLPQELTINAGTINHVSKHAMRPKRLSSRSGCAVELTRLMPNTTQRMLTLQLRELEADGIIARHIYPQVPPKVEYELTPFGRTLAPVLISLREWGESYQTRRAKDVGPGEAVPKTTGTRRRRTTTTGQAA
jgi:DNA-binding HxlR family transcriptional regulator